MGQTYTGGDVAFMENIEERVSPLPPVPEDREETPEDKAIRCVNKQGLTFDQRLNLLRGFLIDDEMVLPIQHFASDGRVAAEALVGNREAEFALLDGRIVHVRARQKEPSIFPFLR